MRDSFQNSPSRRSNGKNRSQDSKRGMLTSLIDREEKPNANPYLDNSLDPHSLQGSKNEVLYKTREYLMPPQAVYQSRGNYHMGEKELRRYPASRTTPPPEVRFQYQANSRGESPISYIPIQNTHTPWVQHQTNEQVPIEIRKTYVPHHIYNHIPVNLANSSSQQPSSGLHTDEAYELLLKEYEKLYVKLEKESELNRELQQGLRTHTDHSHHGPPHIQSQQKKYSLNFQVLHDTLYEMHEEHVNRLTAKRKQACHNRIQELFANAGKEISISSSSLYEEHSY